MSASRQPRGIPVGGEFATVDRDEATVALDTRDTAAGVPETEWLPPGAHRVVPCERCATDPARRDEPGCAYCERGKVTTDRYGQIPWHPGAPGTQVAFEDPRDREWRSATITATTRDDLSEYYAVGLLADGTARDIYLSKAIPVHAAQAAARYGVNSHEMIEEAACEMNIGIDPSRGEVRAFLARIDDGYCEDIARSAREYREYRAVELREEGRTGPPFDRSVNLTPEQSVAVDRAVSHVSDFKGQAYTSMTYVTARESWHGHTVVVTPSGRVATYKDTAWEAPAEQPVLPWSPPVGAPVAHVALDGTVTRVDQEKH